MRTVGVDCNADADKRKSAMRLLVENFYAGGMVHHNFKMSHDGKNILSFDPTHGINIIRNGGEKINIDASIYTRELVWDPTNRYFAFIATKDGGDALQFVDIRQQLPQAREVYQVKAPGNIKGLEWSPRGPELYWIERQVEERGLVYFLKRIDVRSRSQVTLVKSYDAIDFFMPPVSSFENGQGPLDPSETYAIAYGTRRGLFLLDRDGGEPKILCEAPADGVNNLEWSPDRKHLVIYFQRNFRSEKLGELRGVMLAHLEESDPKKVMECLLESPNIHTLWFSPDSKYVLWAKESGCFYRKPDAVGEKGILVPNAVKILEDGTEEEQFDKKVKGAIFNNDSTRLAITAGNQVWVHEPANKKTIVYHEIESSEAYFLAEPRWKGDELILTIFENTRITGREAPRTPRFSEEGAKKIREARQKYLDKAGFLKDEREKYKKREADIRKQRAASAVKAEKKRAETIRKLREKAEREARKKKTG